jgi:hypothetical protein
LCLGNGTDSSCRDQREDADRNQDPAHESATDPAQGAWNALTRMCAQQTSDLHKYHRINASL